MVNWFEGGRRISQLFMGLTALGGLVYVATAASPPVIFSTTASDHPWELADQECNYPDHERYAGKLEFAGGREEPVSLCFRADSDGDVPYAPASSSAREEADETPTVDASAETDASGPPPLVRTVALPRQYYFGSPYSGPASDYVTKRVDAFRLTPQLRNQAQQELGLSWWRSTSAAFSDALPWVLGIMAGLWIFTAIVGWIVRGFAGVPMGQDFRGER